MATSKYTVITYYTKTVHDDGSEESDEDAIGGDYAWIELRDSKGKLIVWYGDYYHDKGEEKMEGFLDALKLLSKEKISVKRKQQATLKDYPDE